VEHRGSSCPLARDRIADLAAVVHEHEAKGTACLPRSSPRLLARQDRRDRRGRGGLVGQALAIDAEVLAHPLNVLASFVEGNALDPVDKISAAGFSRITVRS